MRLRHLFAAAILFGGAARADNATLVEAAKREGRVVWYSTLIVNQLVKPVAEAFQKKYGIPVDYVRSDGSSLVVRLLNESNDFSRFVQGMRREFKAAAAAPVPA